MITLEGNEVKNNNSSLEKEKEWVSHVAVASKIKQRTKYSLLHSHLITARGNHRKCVYVGIICVAMCEHALTTKGKRRHDFPNIKLIVLSYNYVCLTKPTYTPGLHYSITLSYFFNIQIFR